MANRQFYQFRYSLEANVVDLFMTVSFGSTGAPTLTANQNKGIASITRTGAGAYTILFTDNYARLMGTRHTFNEASNSNTAPASPGMWVTADNSASTTAPGIQVTFNSAGTATDPASGEIVLMQITLKNSSI